MSPKTMDERVGALEKTTESLAMLPERVGEMSHRLTNVEVRLTTVERQIVELRTDLTVAKNEIREDIATLGHEMAGRILDTQRHMQALHEDVIGRLAIMSEGRDTREGPRH